MNKTSVTCVIALHREGLLAHTSLCSIALARAFAESNGISVELVITLDNHNASTEEIVRRHPGLRPDDVIECVQYGDLGLSRNHGIAKASGECIITMDGDDYYSENFIAAMATEAAKDRNSAIYPEYLFSFDGEWGYVQLGGPIDPKENSYALFAGHHYCSRVAAHRDIFKNIPYSTCVKGFGFEDWHWNCEARALGITQRIAPGVVLFYRRRLNSMAANYASGAAIIPPSRFFAMLPDPKSEMHATTATHASIIPRAPIPWKAFAKGLVSAALRVLPVVWGNKLYAALRDWRSSHKCALNVFEPALRSALLDAAKIDGLLHPDRLPPTPYIKPVYDEAPGRIYAAAWHSLPTHNYDIVYTAPHIGIGGADLMTINYIESACAAGKRVLCITTDERPNMPEGLPREADLLDLGALLSSLNLEHQTVVLTRLLIQLSPNIIHMVNDWYGFQCILRHGAALRYNSRLFVSIFADAQDDNDIFYGAGTDNLRKLYPYVERTITDNAVTAQNWVRQFGLPEDFFLPVYGLSSNPTLLPCNPKTRNSVLWAGRLDTEKRLDIAYEIMKRLPDIHFDIYGASVMSKKPLSAVSLLQKLPNVRLCGRYDAFSSLPAAKYFVFLYTTQCDGLPNVLLEATAAGLPVVAPDRGGIQDFITNDTGWLISEHTDINAYVNALQEIRDQPHEAQKRWERAQDLLKTRHNMEIFAQNLFAAYSEENSACQRHS